MKQMEVSQDLKDSSSRFDSLDPSQLKIVIVGPSGSGKSSIINNLLGIPFNPDIKSTNCYEIHKKTLEVDDKNISLRFWDCGAYHHQSYSAVKKAFYKGALCALIVCDVSNQELIHQQLDDWINECYECEVYQLIIILNKVDLHQDFRQKLENKSKQSYDVSMVVLHADPKEDKNQLEELNLIFQKKGLRHYYGSARCDQVGVLPYLELLTQLVRENTTNFQSSRYESDRLMATQFKRRLFESSINQLVSSGNRLSSSENNKCIIW